MKNIKTFAEFINEALRDDELETLATKLAHSMPNHTKYDYEVGPTDDQIVKAFKYVPELKQYATAKQKLEAIEIVKRILTESK